MDPSTQNVVMLAGLLGLGGLTAKKAYDKMQDKEFLKKHPDAAAMIESMQKQLSPYGFKFPSKQARKAKAAKKHENDEGYSKPGKSTTNFDTQSDPSGGLVQ